MRQQIRCASWHLQTPIRVNNMRPSNPEHKKLHLRNNIYRRHLDDVAETKPNLLPHIYLHSVPSCRSWPIHRWDHLPQLIQTWAKFSLNDLLSRRHKHTRPVLKVALVPKHQVMRVQVQFCALLTLPLYCGEWLALSSVHATRSTSAAAPSATMSCHKGKFLPFPAIKPRSSTPQLIILLTGIIQLTNRGR